MSPPVGPHPTARTPLELRDEVAAVIRPVTDFERALLDWVVLWDEYRVCGRRFEPDDVVIDVGAHVGVFTALCHRLGSRAIHAFEPDPLNYARLVATVGALDGVTLDSRAVFRSDLPGQSVQLAISGALLDNTGASNVIFGGRPFDVHAQSLGDASADEPWMATAVPLDEVLERVGRVRLLKLDCEGSEFPILLTSRRLDLVDEIVGEYHVVSTGPAATLVAGARLGGLLSYDPVMLGARLATAGFEVRFGAINETIGLFSAVRAERA
jgi:FkbM family methyltransferase